MLKNKFKRKRVVFVAISFLISILALFFVVQNFRDQIVFFYAPSELKQAVLTNKLGVNQEIRIGGLVKKGSVKKDAILVEFVITDKKDEIRVMHRGLVPDLFREGQGIVAKGVFDRKSGVFISNELLVKHDENYMPPEIAG